MKHFSTLFTALAVFLTVHMNAQTTPANYFETFETNPALGGHYCIDTIDMLWANKISNSSPTKSSVINGIGSAYAEPPVSSTTVRVFSTPYLELSPATTISFTYLLNSKLTGQATRFINVGTIDSLGNFVSIDSFGLNPNVITPVSVSYNLTLPGTSIRRVSVRLGGGGGDGNSRVSFDDLAVNAPMYKGGVCNMAPVAVNDTYYATLPGEMLTGNVITDGSNNDKDPDGGTLTAAVVSAPDPATVGTLVLNPDGTFTFTPVVGFGGGLVTFTYKITDNGYAVGSATATVTLDYPAPILIVMPVKLMNFSGSITNNKAQLNWTLAENESGSQAEVLRSTDGKSFTEAGLVFINGKAGTERYSFTDTKELETVTYYKLKIVNKDGSITYSNVIALKSATAKATTDITILKNPVASTLTFTYTSNSSTQGQVSIYNSVGVKVYSSRLSSQKGSNAVSLNLDSHLAAGTYILEVVNGLDRAVTRMIKQ